MDDAGLAAWAGLLRVHASLVPVLDRNLQKACGVPLTWYDVLLNLNAAPERQLTMGQLGASVVVSRTRVSRVVDELEQAGLVERRTNPEDRRSAFAAITPSGRARLRQAATVYLEGVDRHFAARLSASERQAMARGFQRVLNNLGG